MSASGCASAPPPAPAATPRPFPNVQRLAVVASGSSAFVMVENRLEPGRTIDEVLKWHPSGAAFRPLAKILHRGVNRFLNADQEAALARAVGDVAPRSVVASAMAQRLQMTGWFQDVTLFEREPTGEDRRRADAILRVAAPAWGLVRVRNGDPALLSSFADVHAQIMVPSTGATLWEDREDVTGPEPLPLDTFTANRELARQELIAVLERAGQRLASELLYARGPVG